MDYITSLIKLNGKGEIYNSFILRRNVITDKILFYFIVIFNIILSAYTYQVSVC